MTGKALVLGGILATLFIVGIIRRAPEWRAADWVRFGLQLAIASGSVVVALRMAGAVNYGTTGSWSAAMRALWAVGIALGMLFGVGIGIQLLLEFAGTGQEDRPLFRGYLVAFTILSFLFGVAVWLQGAFGLPFQQSGAVVLGGLLLGWVWLVPSGSVGTSGSCSSKGRWEKRAPASSISVWALPSSRWD